LAGNRTSDMSSPHLQRELHTRGIVSSLDRAQSHMGSDCIFTQCFGRNIELTKASSFTFQNDSHVWDAQGFRVDPCMGILKSLSGKLAKLLLRSNVLASVT